MESSLTELTTLVAVAERRVRNYLLGVIGVIALVALLGAVVFHVINNAMNREFMRAMSDDGRKFISDVSRLNFNVTSLSLKDSFTGSQAESVINEIHDIFKEAGIEQRLSLTYLVEEATMAFALAGQIDYVRQLDPYIDNSSKDRPQIVATLNALGVRSVTERYRSEEELELYLKYKRLTPSFPELHILYDALITQGEPKGDVGEVLRKANSLNERDRGEFVRILLAMARGEAVSDSQRAGHLAERACKLIDSGDSAPILEAVSANIGNACMLDRALNDD